MEAMADRPGLISFNAFLQVADARGLLLPFQLAL